MVALANTVNKQHFVLILNQQSKLSAHSLWQFQLVFCIGSSPRYIPWFPACLFLDILPWQMNQIHPYKSSVSIYRSSRSVSRWSWWFLYASHSFWSVRGALLRQAHCCLTGGFMLELERLCNPVYLFLVACLSVYQHLFYWLDTRCVWYARSTLWLLKPISLCIWICKCHPVPLYHDKLARWCQSHA